MKEFAIAIHGGAGTILRSSMTPEKEKSYKDALTHAITAGERILEKGGSSLDAVEAAIRSLEDNELFNAGRGSVFTHDGHHEMDASLMEGQTLGKRLFSIKVVKIDGYQASFIDYLTRWVFRLVDITGSLCLVGTISMIASKIHQRLGDMAAGTAVISLKNDINISHTILENISKDYQPVYAQVVRFSDNDMRIIKETYLSARKNNDYHFMKLT